MCIPAYVLLTVCTVMNVIVMILMEYENCGRLECDAMWSVYQRTHCSIPEDCNPECWCCLCLDNPLVTQRVNWFPHCQAILRTGFSDEYPPAPD